MLSGQMRLLKVLTTYEFLLNNLCAINLFKEVFSPFCNNLLVFYMFI